jgi:hypothetical protein
MRVEVLDHENHYGLEVVKVSDYTIAVPQGTFNTGDLALYVPSGAVVPEYLIPFTVVPSGEQVTTMGRNMGYVIPLTYGPGLDGILGWNLHLSEEVSHLNIQEGENLASFLGITQNIELKAGAVYVFSRGSQANDDMVSCFLPTTCNLN